MDGRGCRKFRERVKLAGRCTCDCHKRKRRIASKCWLCGAFLLFQHRGKALCLGKGAAVDKAKPCKKTRQAKRLAATWWRRGVTVLFHKNGYMDGLDMSGAKSGIARKTKDKVCGETSKIWVYCTFCRWVV